MFENPRRGRQARNFTTNVPKILVLKSSPEQIFSRKLPLGAPDLERTNGARDGGRLRTLRLELHCLLCGVYKKTAPSLSPMKDFRKSPWSYLEYSVG